MPFLVAALLGGLGQVLASYVGRVLLALGMTFVTYKGLNVATDSLVNMIKSSYSGLPSDALNLLSYLWIDRALSLIVSAFTSALAIKTSAGSITKLVIKKP